MSQEIIEAVREIEREKGIEEGALVAALEDALLAAYKKTTGASRHAAVEMDDGGDFRVYSIELPSDVSRRRRASGSTRSSPTTTSTSTGPTSPRIRSSAKTSHPKASAASPRRLRSRSSCSASARKSAG